jgi:hypothetical protein
MVPNLSQISDLQKNHVEAVHAAGATLITAVEQLTQLQLASARAWMDGAGQLSGALFEDPQRLAATLGDMVQPATEYWGGVARGYLAISCHAQAELTRIIGTRVAAGNGKVVEIVDTTLQDAPAGSEPTVALVKQALSASNLAYDAIARAARQAVEFAESNLAAVTLPAVGASSS